MEIDRSRRLETLIYFGLWIVVIGLCLLDAVQARYISGYDPLDWNVIESTVVSVVPFVVMFLINNSVLIPKMLFRNRYQAYFMAIALLFVAVCVCQYQLFMSGYTHNAIPHGESDHPGPRPLFPFPVFLDFVYALLLIGANLVVALIFQRYDDRLEKESLMKANAENQLAYLKTQINPHFYMNMLNNIHGMIEIDSAKAQEMLIEMSQLMRYMLYESSRPLISLADEINFLRNYLSLMRQRYPESRVTIDASFPAESDIVGIKIAPLLFLVFIENAFKHGINYARKSFVRVEVTVYQGIVTFRCVNSNNAVASGDRAGIGLQNAGQRLKLIYGNGFDLNIESDESEYAVTLTIPSNGDKSIDNR